MIECVNKIHHNSSQAVYSGSGPNKTIDHITEQSGIIELYRSCHENIEDNFEISSRTVRHAAANMEVDIVRLASELRYDDGGAGAYHGVVAVEDQLAEGYSLLQASLAKVLVSGLTDQDDSLEQDENRFDVEEADLSI